jgi:hypothetical protein
MLDLQLLLLLRAFFASCAISGALADLLSFFAHDFREATIVSISFGACLELLLWILDDHVERNIIIAAICFL